MKNLLFSLIATVLFVFKINAQNIEESTVLLTKERVYVKSGGTEKSARTFLLLNFDKSNKLMQEYNVDGYLYTDSGQKNDLKAGDGVYTSVDLFPNLKDNNTGTSYLMKSDLFKYNDELAQQISANRLIVKFTCKIKHMTSGYTSILGLDCSQVLGGCIVFYDCKVTVEVGFLW